MSHELELCVLGLIILNKTQNMFRMFWNSLC